MDIYVRPPGKVGTILRGLDLNGKNTHSFIALKLMSGICLVFWFLGIVSGDENVTCVSC